MEYLMKRSMLSKPLHKGTVNNIKNSFACISGKIVAQHDILKEKHFNVHSEYMAQVLLYHRKLIAPMFQFSFLFKV